MRASGLSTAAVYRYISGKDELAETAARLSLGLLAVTLEGLASRSLPAAR